MTRFFWLSAIALGLYGMAGAQAPSDSAGPALNSPDCLKAPDARAEQDGDEELAVGRGGEFCAYPLRMMAYHRVVNDHLGGPPIVVAYDPDSGAGQVYDPVVEGKELHFDAAESRGGAPAIRDRETKSVWSLLAGDAVEGPMSGKRLVRIPSMIVSWQRWRALHPDSWVLKDDPKQSAHYVARVTPASCPLPPNVQESLAGRVDRRLPPDSLVLGVMVGRKGRAYPLASLGKTLHAVNDRIGAEPVVIFSDPYGRMAAAFHPTIQGKALTFTALHFGNDSPLFTDAETHSLWSIEGRATNGPLKGNALAPAAFARSRWYAWSAVFAATDIYKAGKRAASTTSSRAPRKPRTTGSGA